MAKQTTNKGNDILFIFAYLIPILTGLLMYITVGQTNKRMKFHSLQAIMLGIVLIVLGWIPIIGLIGLLVWLYGLYVGWRAYEGEDLDIPVIGDFAHQYSK